MTQVQIYVLDFTVECSGRTATTAFELEISGAIVCASSSFGLSPRRAAAYAQRSSPRCSSGQLFRHIAEWLAMAIEGRVPATGTEDIDEVAVSRYALVAQLVDFEESLEHSH
jgi:hypothetical protein